MEYQHESRILHDKMAVKDTISSYSLFDRLIDRNTRKADPKVLAQLKDIFTPEVYSDYTSLVGGEAGNTMSSDMLIVFAKALSVFDATHHIKTDVIIDIRGSKATAYVPVCINYMFGFGQYPFQIRYAQTETWTVYGYYDFELVWQEDRWRICSVKFTLTSSQGNQWGWNLLMDALAKAAEQVPV